MHREELVRANASGVGQFQFHDGTKLAIGPNASVKIDKFVLGEGGKVKKLTIRATKGTFRWISGKSPSSAYTLPRGHARCQGLTLRLAVVASSSPGFGRVFFRRKALALRCAIEAGPSHRDQP